MKQRNVVDRAVGGRGGVVTFLFCAVFVARASAQTITPPDYLPLGADPQWLFERVAGSGPNQTRIDIVDVNPVDSGVRYLLEIPLEGLTTHIRLEIANDGTLFLRTVEADLREVLEDLPGDPEATADVQLTPPALLGAATLTAGSAVFQTPVDTQIDADLDTGIGTIDLDVDVTGSVGATWEPTPALDTSAGRFEDVVHLTIDVHLRYVEDALDSDVTVDERIEAVLARGVGFVEITVGKTTYRLLRAIVGGQPIGDFAQYEDIVGMTFTVPAVLTLDGRAAGEAVAGGIALHDIRLGHTLYGHAVLDAVLDHPAVTGVAVHLDGKAKARKDGALNVELDGKTVALDQKVKLKVKQRVDPTTTTLALQLKAGKVKTTVPITIHPVPASAVDVSLDGLVDQSTGSGNKRKLASEGVLRLGDLAYPVGCTENLELKKNGQHKRTYKFRQAGNDTVVLMMKAISTSAADFTTKAFKPKFFKREIPKKDVTDLVVDVVAPSSAP
jgi:hypothetical protein